MATYTTLLRSIVEQRQADEHVGPDDFTVAYATLGLDGYPIFDEAYRAPLNDKIIRHFYFREIGQETVARFRWYMDMTMRENMPYFNQLYKSLNLIVDPITNVRYTYRDVTNLETLDTGSSQSSRTGSTARNTYETHGGDDVTEAARGTTATETLQHGKTVTETIQHGKTVTDTYQHGHTLTDTNTYGKTGHTVEDTHYGRTENTTNSGHDDVLEGSTHERTIKSDTPMNQITNSGVENLDYATEVDYTDREGRTAGRTDFGGVTDVTTGGSDFTTTDVTDGGTDSATHAHTGTDTDTRANTGTDTDTTTNAGTDTTTTTHAGTDTTTLTHGETVTTNDGTSMTEGTESGTERTIDTDTTKDHTGSGYQGTSPSVLLEEYRKTFLNIDMQVIASLERLFFGLWD